jgi:hypothetical protein
MLPGAGRAIFRRPASTFAARVGRRQGFFARTLPARYATSACYDHRGTRSPPAMIGAPALWLGRRHDRSLRREGEPPRLGLPIVARSAHLREEQAVTVCRALRRSRRHALRSPAGTGRARIIAPPRAPHASQCCAFARHALGGMGPSFRRTAAPIAPQIFCPAWRVLRHFLTVQCN